MSNPAPNNDRFDEVLRAINEDSPDYIANAQTVIALYSALCASIISATIAAISLTEDYELNYPEVPEWGIPSVPVFPPIPDAMEFNNSVRNMRSECVGFVEHVTPWSKTKIKASQLAKYGIELIVRAEELTAIHQTASLKLLKQQSDEEAAAAGGE